MQVSSLTLLKNLISENSAVLVYFHHEKCSVCKVIQPKLEETIKNNFPNIHYVTIDTKTNPDIPAQYQIFTLPALLIFFEGKLYLQKAKSFSLKELCSLIERPYKLLFG